MIEKFLKYLRMISEITSLAVDRYYTSLFASTSSNTIFEFSLPTTVDQPSQSEFLIGTQF